MNLADKVRENLEERIQQYKITDEKGRREIDKEVKKYLLEISLKVYRHYQKYYERMK